MAAVPYVGNSTIPYVGNSTIPNGNSTLAAPLILEVVGDFDEEFEDDGTTKAPKIKKIGKVQVKKGKRITIRCKVSANPPPKITWVKDGEVLRKRKGLKLKVNKKGTVSVVKVSKASAKDAGIYTCRAINQLGESAKNVSVTVLLPESSTTTVTPTSPSLRRHWRECEQQTFCLNKGVCLELPSIGEKFCRCPSNFSGVRCEEQQHNVPRVLPGLEQPKKVIAMGVAMGVIIGVLLFIVMIMCFLYNRKRRGRQNNYNIAEHDIPLFDQVDSRTAATRPLAHPALQKATDPVSEPNHRASPVRKGPAVSNEERHHLNSTTSFGSRLPSRKRLSGVSQASSGSGGKNIDPSGACVDDTNNSLPSQSSNTESCQPALGSTGSSPGSRRSVNGSVIGNTVATSNNSLYDNNDHSGQYPKHSPTAGNYKSNNGSPAKKADVSIFDEEQLKKNGIFLDRETNI